ncbi:type II toxin-antitoxin system RelE/ParE family toxin [Candidatus Pacearchaeota archaeon]|nr:type II toxin-antitoxin system RelE/ParE family toxin [Candidatus Pacearchaeota archaeon]
MYSVEFSETAEKEFNKLEENVQFRVVNVMERIRIRPYHFIKRKEGTSYFIARIGGHRAILSIDDVRKTIFVLEVGHRKNIYD